MSKRTASTGHGSLATGAVTALALAVQTGLAAVVGVAHRAEARHTRRDGRVLRRVRRLHRARARAATRPRDGASAVRPCTRGGPARASDGRVRGRGGCPRSPLPLVARRDPGAGADRGRVDRLRNRGRALDGGRRDAALADRRGTWARSWRGCRERARRAGRLRRPRRSATSAGALAGLGADRRPGSARTGSQAVAWGMALNAAIAPHGSRLVLARRARAERMSRGRRSGRGGAAALGAASCWRRRCAALRAPGDLPDLPAARARVKGEGDGDELRLRVPLLVCGRGGRPLRASGS